MRKEKAEAIILRRKGLSYSQIAKRLNLSKSTLSFWLKGIVLSSKLQQKINKRANQESREALIRRNKMQTELAAIRAQEIKRAAENEAKKLIKQPLFIMGVSLYWAEGYKMGDNGSKWKSFDLANSDPEIIKLMIRFIKKYLPEGYPKIVIQIIGHDNIDIKKAVSYWSQLTGVSKNRFIKTTIYNNTSSKGIRNKKRLPYGTIHLRINDVKIFFRIIGWINEIKKLNNGV